MGKVEHNPQLDLLSVAPISLSDAKGITVARHYMRTWPQGARLAFGLFMARQCLGVMVLGYAPTTEKKVKKYTNNIRRDQYIELQRTWVSDKLGHNAESWFMARAMRSLKKIGIWVVLTHSGGCKDDVGFIFQASGWLYFGAEKCNDFFKTAANEYKNLVSALRFGRVPKDIISTGSQSCGEYLFGPGQIVEARRHLYLYPIKKGIRRRLKKYTSPFPKNPAVYRLNQAWGNDQMEVRARGANA